MAAAVLGEIDGWFAPHLQPAARGGRCRRAIADMLKAIEVYFNSGRRVCLVGPLPSTDCATCSPRIRGYFAAWTEELKAP